MFQPAQGLHVEAGLLSLGERVIEKIRDLRERDVGQKVLGGLHVLGRDVGDAGVRPAVALFDKEIRDLERLRDLLAVGVKIELDASPLPAPRKSVVGECRAGPEGDDKMRRMSSRLLKDTSACVGRP